MGDLSSVGVLVALGAAAASLVALAVAAALVFKLRTLRRGQEAVLGDGRTDLVTHAAGLQERFGALAAGVQAQVEDLHARVTEAEGRLDGAIAYRAIVRYDAYNEMSGRQSTSIALLDAGRSGIVLSSIHHREQARLYVKRVAAGQGDLELSPEEAEAVRLALERGGQPTASLS